MFARLRWGWSDNHVYDISGCALTKVGWCCGFHNERKRLNGKSYLVEHVSALTDTLGRPPNLFLEFGACSKSFFISRGVHQKFRRFPKMIFIEPKLKSLSLSIQGHWQLLSKLLKVAEIFGKNNLFDVMAVDSCNVGLCLWQSFGLEIFPSSSILIKTRNKEPSNMRSPGFI